MPYCYLPSWCLSPTPFITSIWGYWVSGIDFSLQKPNSKPSRVVFCYPGAYSQALLQLHFCERAWLTTVLFFTLTSLGSVLTMSVRVPKPRAFHWECSTSHPKNFILWSPAIANSKVAQCQLLLTRLQQWVQTDLEMIHLDYLWASFLDRAIMSLKCFPLLTRIIYIFPTFNLRHMFFIQIPISFI